MQLPYKDRTEAGCVLAKALASYAGRKDVLVLGLARGGVIVAGVVARSLEVLLDVMIVRKLGLPGQEELAMGAITLDGRRILNAEVIRGCKTLSADDIDAVTKRETQELHRQLRVYRGDRAAVEIKDRCVVLVDDGLATGSTMRVAILAVRDQDPALVVVAVPVAPPDVIDSLRDQVDEVVCPSMPPMFRAVGQWYNAFDQVGDDQVRQCLEQAQRGTV